MRARDGFHPTQIVPLRPGIDRDMAKASPIEIFRAGRHTAVDGTVHDFTVEDLQAAVAAYDYAAEPAPLVIGHPKLDAPAYGWAERLEVVGDKVLAYPDQVEPAFAEQVNAGRYKRVSASWYPKNAGQNPKPGSLYLKHVGFLGAAAPAVRGLQPVHFSEAQDAAAITFDNDPVEDGVTDRTQEFAEREGALDAREQELADREATIAANEAAAVEATRAGIHAGHVSFAEAQVTAGRLAPVGKDLVVGILDTLVAAEPINFGEADGELRPVDAFRKLLTGAAPIVSFSEHAPADALAEGGKKPEKIAEEALSFMESEKEAGRTVTHAAAVRHVMAPGA